ncbi:preprotein translocase subunit SecG [Novosphingobium sp. 9U]|uniref:preprotein translocase subunit SecG n=1 Tax=Novosphingobium sp. 9U TaxID=2653158 RepID=UPI0012F37396|nr:preprotein translocase subunit SecG [Novosphingobium sp. 9U]VWX51954.1 Preprotein translocase subunit SecG (TC 3.A.5.1.1) [Novosphingobium sp. 9U]
MFTFLTVVQALIAAALVGVILMQQSEGGGLGTGGGNPSGLMSARGAANFLTRATAVLATLFVVLSIILAALAVDVTTGRQLDTSLQRNAPVHAPADPLAGTTNPGAAPAPVERAPASPVPANDPLAGSAAK